MPVQNMQLGFKFAAIIQMTFPLASQTLGSFAPRSGMLEKIYKEAAGKIRHNKNKICLKKVGETTYLMYEDGSPSYSYDPFFFCHL